MDIAPSPGLFAHSKPIIGRLLEAETAAVARAFSQHVRSITYVKGAQACITHNGDIILPAFDPTRILSLAEANYHRGLRDHELGHRLFTDFAALAADAQSYAHDPVLGVRMAYLINAIEDHWMERQLCYRIPGATPHIAEMRRQATDRTIERFRDLGFGPEGLILPRRVSGYIIAFANHMGDQQYQPSIELMYRYFDSLPPDAQAHLDRLPEVQGTGEAIAYARSLLPWYRIDDPAQAAEDCKQGECNNATGNHFGDSNEKPNFPQPPKQQTDGFSDESGSDGKTRIPTEDPAAGESGGRGSDEQDSGESVSEQASGGGACPSAPKRKPASGADLKSAREKLEQYAELCQSQNVRKPGHPSGSRTIEHVDLTPKALAKHPLVDHYTGGTAPSFDAQCRADSQAISVRLRTTLRRFLVTRSETRIVRNMDSGDLDTTQLHRVAFYDFEIYQESAIRLTNDVDMKLLVDASSSMLGAKIRAAALAGLALEGAVHNIRGIAYSVHSYTSTPEGDLLLVTHRRADYRALATGLGVLAEGHGIHRSTPSGPALLALLQHHIDLGKPRRIIIHVHDGGPDDPRTTAEAKALATALGVHILAISIIDPDILKYRAQTKGKPQDMAAARADCRAEVEQAYQDDGLGAHEAIALFADEIDRLPELFLVNAGRLLGAPPGLLRAA